MSVLWPKKQNKKQNIWLVKLEGEILVVTVSRGRNLSWWIQSNTICKVIGKKGIRATLRKANKDVLKPGKCSFTDYFQNQELSNAFSNIYSRFKYLKAILDGITKNYSIEKKNTRAVCPHDGWITRLLSCYVVASVKMQLFYSFLEMLLILFWQWHNFFFTWPSVYCAQITQHAFISHKWKHHKNPYILRPWGWTQTGMISG